MLGLIKLEAVVVKFLVVLDALRCLTKEITRRHAVLSNLKNSPGVHHPHFQRQTLRSVYWLPNLAASGICVRDVETFVNELPSALYLLLFLRHQLNPGFRRRDSGSGWAVFLFQSAVCIIAIFRIFPRHKPALSNQPCLRTLGLSVWLLCLLLFNCYSLALLQHSLVKLRMLLCSLSYM